MPFDRIVLAALLDNLP